MMNKLKLFIITLLMTVAFTFVNLISVNANTNASVYTISDTTYDEESGKLSYQKITYNKNTYETLNTTTSDAAGESTGVSDDAEYVFFPARYLDFTDSTKVSFKYKNNGVKKIVVHAEYSAGISSGGVDYKAGYKIICMDALDADTSWNVTEGKSADGYDVFTISFGSYALEIHDISFVGFRLYFDYGETVTNERSFEVYGYEIHEKSIVPTFASDPKSMRISKLQSDDVTIENNNMFTVNGSAKIKANILDPKEGYEYLEVTFRVKGEAKVSFKLDDTLVLENRYDNGTHTASLPLNKAQFSKLEMIFEASNTTIIIRSFDFKGEPYFGDLGGAGFTVSKSNGQTIVKYNYVTSWNHLSAEVKEYNAEYTDLIITFEVLQPTLIGILIDGKTMVDHWKREIHTPDEYTIPIDVSELGLDAGSVIEFYIDPDVGKYEASTGEKTIIFKKLAFEKAPELPSATVTVDPLFEFDYDGSKKAATGATTNSGSKIYYEYKLESQTDKYYTDELPVDAGRYDVRVVSPRSETNALTYAYSKLVINKVKAIKPTAEVLDIDYFNNKISYDSNKYLVSTDENFTQIVNDGGNVKAGSTLYIKELETNNTYESDVTQVQLPSQTEKFNVSINYKNETTNENILDTVEYSTDGINWTLGKGRKITLVPGNIYLFRYKATDEKFAGEITYLQVAPRPETTAKLVVESTTSTSVTLAIVEGAEYCFEGYKFKASNVLVNEDGGVAIVCMRMAATETSFASETVYVKLTLGNLSTVTDYTKPTESTTPQTPTIPATPTIKDDELVLENTDEVSYVVRNYSELVAAVAKTSKNYMTTIIIEGSIALQGDLKISGKVKFVGSANAELVFEYNGTKYKISNTKDSDIQFENLTIKRTVVNTTQTYIINCLENGRVSFTEVTFDIAISSDGVNADVDRITYCPDGVDLVVIFNNCTYNTQAYFYRGTFIFINDDELPKTNKATVYDFNKIKVRYDKHVLRFPVTFKVSEDEDFTELVATGSLLKSNTTYYVTNGEIVFSFTTKNIKLANPTINDLAIDYYNEKVYFSDKYLVATNSDMTEILSSGATITPGATLYVKRLGEDIYLDSDVVAIKLPERPTMPQLNAEIVTDFGFVMEGYENAVYSIDGSIQLSPVFVGLESNKTYTVSVYLFATESTFRSQVYETTVTIK